jgi:hypothetical protein
VLGIQLQLRPYESLHRRTSARSIGLVDTNRLNNGGIERSQAMITFIFATGALLLVVVGYGPLEPIDDQVAPDGVGQEMPIMEAMALSSF